MSPLVIALTLVATTPPPSLPPSPHLASLRDAFRMAPAACRDIDPHFVRYVAPPKGAGPLWGIERGEGGAAQVRKSIPQRFDCPRLMAASGAR
jgi:hypothetical protein